VGVYTSDEVQATHKIIFKDNLLRVQVGKKPSMPLKPRRKDFFWVAGGRLQFTRNEKGQIIGFTRTEAMARNIRFSRVTN